MIIKKTQLFQDITDLVQEEVKGKDKGLVNIFSRHTTACLKILEDEKLLMADYRSFFENIAPRNGYYAHNIIEAREVPENEPLNGHSHIRALFAEHSITIPFTNGKLDIGKWQRIFLVDFDEGRDREIIISFL